MWKPSVNAIWLLAAGSVDASITARSRRDLVALHADPPNSLVGHRGACPADYGLFAVLVRRQQCEVNRAPGELCLQAGHRASAEHLHHRRAAADSGHRPLVAIGERLGLLAGDPAGDRLAD